MGTAHKSDTQVFKVPFDAMNELRSLNTPDALSLTWENRGRWELTAQKPSSEELRQNCEK